MQPLYLVMGCAGSGRRRLLAELLPSIRDQHADRSGETLVWWAAEDGPAPDAESAWQAVEGVRSQPYGFVDEQPQWPAPNSVTSAAVIVLFLGGRRNPVPQIEALTQWLADGGVGVARTLAVVHCGLLVERPGLLPWFEACLHFADVGLLHQRESVPNKWLSDFRTRFEKERWPLLFELVRKGPKVPQPAALVVPEARRLSLAFEELEWQEHPVEGGAMARPLHFFGASGPAPSAKGRGPDLTELGYPTDDDLSDAALSDETEEEDADEVIPWNEDDEPLPPEPYFERDAEGRYLRPIPAIAPFLPPANRAETGA